ncbi:MAG TPA: hypothetical protein VG318_12405 [Actinomycetota bacterium]|nr:hypothetical protein [Actinomycetota bacterium]
MTVVTASGVALAWVLQAVGLSRVMKRRGFDGLPWLVTPLVLGPAAWPLALSEVRRGLPRPEVVRWGTAGEGAIDVFVVLEDDALPPETVAQLRRVLPYSRRVVVARALRSGGPSRVARDARRFLTGIADGLRLEGAELQLVYGTVNAVVRESRRRGEFGIILRSDQPAELFDGDGSRQEVRCERDVSVA